MKKVVLGALLLAAAGCKSNPYCLNCKDSGNGVIAPEDMTPPDDLAEAADLSGPDLLGQGGGPCAPTHGGIETCDGIDNDCNGKIDDVNPESLVGDPNNCGACGNVCKYVHAGGQCVGGWDGGMPTCKMGSCQPGYVDLDGDPTNGCEYTCAQTNGGVEICDGVDNNCDGRVDENFTTTWLDAAKQKPAYDKDINNCGQCAGVCNLGQGTVMGCQAPAAGQLGQCVVVSCFNGLDANGVHQTYRHNPNTGKPINVTGCDYHCPKSASQLNIDCNTDGACTFPAEVCNAIDDDCNFQIDDNLTDPGIGVACPDGAPGKLCTSTGANATCGKGVCAAGTYQCVSGTLTCQGSVGPSPELCDAIDNNCDGQVDEPFTATWKDAGKQQPRYDSDPSNCGGCTTGATSFKCALPNATNICRLFAGDTLGSCAVAACNSGWNYVGHTDSNPSSPTCDVVTTGNENSTQTTTGKGCFYKCPSTTPSTEVCDGSDNDCDGCIDNGLTAPDICAKQGVCFNSGVKAACGGASGWKCDYSKIPNISIDGSGNLTAAEKQCDTLDNNCNGPCDENFPDTALAAGGTCTNAPRTPKNCTAGLGVCQATAPYVCANSGGPTPPPYNDIEVCSATPNTAAATDEKCNGKDDDCDGLVDESTDDASHKGWHDPMVQLPSGVWVYQYEASRPDATGLKSGSSSVRACSNVGVIPWSNVTLAQAQAACAAIKDSTGKAMRLCTATEWQTACDKGNSGNNWSLSSSTSTYVSGVCNDQGETEQRCLTDAQCAGAAGSCDTTLHRCKCATSTDCNVGFTCSSGVCTGSGVWATGVSGTTSSEQCYTPWGTAGAHDMTGNLFEWTSTNVVLKSGSSASITNASGGQATLSGLTSIYPSDVGAQIILTSGTAGDSGTFTIVSVVSSTSVVINDASAVAASGISWQFVYTKVRGGSFSSTSGGDTCEFDFDIQKASFSNTDLGFRCCADNQP